MRLPQLSWAGFCFAFFGFAQPVSAAVSVPGNYPTIQSAINAVVGGLQPNGTVIEVQPGVYNEALLINTTARSVTVRGVSGSAATTVNATSRNQSALRVLRATGAVRFEGLTFRGGLGVPGTGGGFTFEDASPVLSDVIFENNSGMDSGGGVIIRSHAQFSNCIIRNNTAQRFGGGVVIVTGSKPVFTNCQIRNNVSGTGGAGVGSIGSGGGVHVNDASPTFRGCVISGNQSKFGAGGIFQIGLYDSAYGPAMLLLEDTEVSNNVTSRFSPSDNPAEGGGVHIEDNSIGYLVRARIIGNTANTAGGLSSYRARYEVTSSVIESNHAQDSLGVGGFGGGIAIGSNNVSAPLRPAGTLVLTDSVVRSNDSRIGGGIFVTGDQHCGSATPSCNPSTALRASLQITQSLIASNVAGLQGGGMRIDRTDVTMSGTHILGNSANVTPPNGSFGGGIVLSLGSTANITSSTIARNTAVDIGGGLFVDEAVVLNVNGSTIYANSANSGGGLYVGNIGVSSGTVQNSTIADNFNYQIHEQACGPLVRTILNYSNNNIVPRSGQSDLYFSTCGGATTTISGFNGLPSGRASGNTSTAPSFVTFLATPDFGPAVLSWSVSRAAGISIAGVGSSTSDTGTANVAPASSRTYTLTNSGGPGTAPSVYVTVAGSWGASIDTPVTGDFDGDNRNDWAVYRASTGQWFLLASTAGFSQIVWGEPSLGDMPVAADYDGDGRTDIAVFRQATGQWFVRYAAGGGAVATWGNTAYGDVPVPADYDGDSKADVAVYRRTTGQWFVRGSLGGSTAVTWGDNSLGDIPAPADYDGDGRADITVYRASSGQWFIVGSTAGIIVRQWGAPSHGDVPVPADYDGDGRDDIAVARGANGDWFVSNSGGGVTTTRWGFGDARIAADYDGDGTADVAIWRAASGSWLIQP